MASSHSPLGVCSSSSVRTYAIRNHHSADYPASGGCFGALGGGVYFDRKYCTIQRNKKCKLRYFNRTKKTVK